MKKIILLLVCILCCTACKNQETKEADNTVETKQSERAMKVENQSKTEQSKTAQDSTSCSSEVKGFIATEENLYYQTDNQVYAISADDLSEKTLLLDYQISPKLSKYLETAGFVKDLDGNVFFYFNGDESCQLYAINGTEMELVTTTKTGVAWIGKAGQVQYWRDLNRTTLKQREKNIYKQEKEERTAIYQYTGDIETVLQDDIWMIGNVEGQGGIVKLNTETAEAEVVEAEECDYLEGNENQIIIAKEDEDQRILYAVDTKTKKVEKIPNSSCDWLGLYEGSAYTYQSQEDGTYKIYKDGKEYGKWGEMTGIQYAKINQKGIYVFTYGAKDSKLYKMPW